MYAVIANGGKQYRVQVGDVLDLEKVETLVGGKLEFSEVLMVADGDKIQLGQPYLKGAKVLGEVKEQKRGDKIRIVKFRRRKHYLKQAGHRQYYTSVTITKIEA
jgi:large subunit ribosomal protein L21